MRKTERQAVSLGSLLSRYKIHLRAPEGAVIEAFIAVAGRYDISLTRKECGYNVSTRALSIRSSGPKKTEIFLKKGDLLRAITEVLGTRNAPKDII